MIGRTLASLFLILCADALAACSSCDPPSGSASLTRTSAVQGAAPVTFQLSLGVPAQSCGGVCTLGCGAPSPSMTVSFAASVPPAGGPSASTTPIVRIGLEQTAPPPPPDALNPPLPVDLVLASGEPAQVDFTTVPSCIECNLDYTLTLVRVDHAPLGSVNVAWSANAFYNSTHGPTLDATP